MRIGINHYYYFYNSLYLFIQLLEKISSNYIYQQLDGNLINGKLTNFSIFTKTFTGMVLYGMDSKNKILIEMENSQLCFKLNEYYTIENSEHLCGCVQCSEIYMTFILHLENRYIITNCNSRTQKLDANRTDRKTISEIFNGYPLPVSYNKNVNRTFVWMGNIGPYTGPNYIVYHALNNQLMGCLHKFYFNGNQVSVKSNGNKFKSVCPIEYNETICLINNQCTNSSVSYDITDCSISSLNRRFCVKHLYPYNRSNNSLLINFNDEMCIFRIDWMINSNKKNRCLLEFLLKNGNTLLFYITELNNNIVMINKNEYASENERNLTSISLNSHQTIIVNFTETEIILRLSDGDNINTFILPQSSVPISVRIGLPIPGQNCQRFDGLIRFQNKTCRKRWIKTTSTSMSAFSTTNLTTLTTTRLETTNTKSVVTKSTIPHTTSKINKLNMKEIKEEVKVTTTNILLIVISVFVFFILFLIVFYCVIRKEVRTHLRKISSVPVPLPPVIRPDIKTNPNEYELLSDDTYTSTRDSGGYEIIPETS